MEQVDASKFPVINMLNTRYFIFPAGQQGTTTLPLQNPYACGHAWFVSEVRYVANANEELDALGDIAPLQTAVVDSRFRESLQGFETDTLASAGTLTLHSYQPNHLVYHSSNNRPGVALFSEIYYPDGWQVSIDGQPAPMARANYVLRALHLPAGQHTIEMRFDPQSLHTTEAIAYGALALLLVGLFAALIRMRR